ncbi:Facilitated trehalose transporter Tret1 [Chamberlinius hualienensis]
MEISQSLESTSNEIQNFGTLNRAKPVENASSNWTYKHIIATCVACLGMFSIGAGTQGYVTTAIPNLNSNNNNPFHMTTVDTLVFITMNNVSACISSILATWWMDRFGRKLSMVSGSVLILIGLVVISASVRVYMMHIGQFIAGLGAGIAQPAIVVYIAEISPKSIRGSLLSYFEASHSLGLLYIFIVGAYVNWRWQAIACAIVAFLNLCTLALLPDSPRWYYLIGKQQATKQSLSWFYKDENDIIQSISEIEESQKNKQDVISWRDFIKCPLLKIVLISQILFFIREFSGINTLRKFAVTVFGRTGSSLSANEETIIYGSGSVFGGLVCILLADRLRRRTLLIATCGIVSVSMALIGIYFKLVNEDYTEITKHITWLPLLLLIIIVIAYNNGLGTLPYAICTEMFPTNSRAKANGLTTMGYYLWSAVSNWLYAQLLTTEYDAIAFFIFSVMAAVGIVFTYFAIPETKFKIID